MAGRGPATLARGDGLAGGLAGPAGRFVVLRGAVRDGERIELVHVRARPDAPDDRLEARTLAVSVVRPDDAVSPGATAGSLLRIADAVGHIGARRAREARGLRRLNRGLARATATRRALELHREPLAWAAGAVAIAVLVAAARHLLGVTDDPLAHGLGNRILSFAWPLSVIVLLWSTARAIRDPYGDDR